MIKYLNNEITTKELVELQEWLSENPGHSKILTQLKSYEEVTEVELNDMKNLMWDDLRSKIRHEEDTVSLKKVKNKSGIGVYFKLAAAIVIVISAVLVIYNSYNTPSESLPKIIYAKKSAGTGQKITTRLPDGTVVILNSESSITFPQSFEADKRVVQLSGEAFFNVKRDISCPFYVQFKDSEVKVLGTSFNIRTYNQENMVSVAVATGKVSFTSTPAQSEVILEPNQMISYDKVKQRMIKKRYEPLEVLGWKDKILYFKNDEFKNIINELERWYGVDIRTERDFSKKGTFSGEFNNKSLENVLMGLSYLYEFEYDINENIVTLK